jgi:hypothetical protein
VTPNVKKQPVINIKWDENTTAIRCDHDATTRSAATHEIAWVSRAYFVAFGTATIPYQQQTRTLHHSQKDLIRSVLPSAPPKPFIQRVTFLRSITTNLSCLVPKYKNKWPHSCCRPPNNKTARFPNVSCVWNPLIRPIRASRRTVHVPCKFICPVCINGGRKVLSVLRVKSHYYGTSCKEIVAELRLSIELKPFRK